MKTVLDESYLAVYNAGVLGPKVLAKKVAKDTGKVAVGVPEKIIKGQVRLEPSKEPPLLPPSDKATINSSNYIRCSI